MPLPTHMYFETNQPHKVPLMQQMLTEHGINCTLEHMPALAGPSYVATLGRLEDVAEARAREIYGRIRRPVVVDEQGYYLPVLADFPGPVTHYALRTIGLGGILRMMRGESDRRCYLRTAIAFIDGNGKVHKFVDQGILGWLGDNTESAAAAGDPWQKATEQSPDPMPQVFIPENHEVALATLTPVQLYEYYRDLGASFAYGQFIDAVERGLLTPQPEKEPESPALERHAGPR